MIKLGVDVLLEDHKLLRILAGKRVAVLGHPASVTNKGVGTLEALAPLLNISAVFGPQHGMRGDKQDNMVESADYLDPVLKVPVFSLYGEVRKPTDAMMNSFDVILIDMQDVGTRIYTFLTTLRYVLEACAQKQKSVWVLDRPNPAGRPIEGMSLRPGWESFVGAGRFPMRHGLTLAEAAKWFVKELQLKVDLHIVAMQGYEPLKSPGYGWPLHELAWVNPSPNAASYSMPRIYPGSVLLEGTHLSEGRGTTRPLEIFGVPGVDMKKVLAEMQKRASAWLEGCWIRTCYFEPTFHKHKGEMCEGLQVHVDGPQYDHLKFKPYRLVSLWLKVIHELHPEIEIFRDFHYEYEKTRLAFDLINGGPELREWIENKSSEPGDLDKICNVDERAWLDEIRPLLLY